MENTSSLEPDWWAWVQSLALPVPSWGLLGISHSLFGLSFLSGRTKIPTSRYYLEKVKRDSRGEHSELCLAPNRHSFYYNDLTSYFLQSRFPSRASNYFFKQKIVMIFFSRSVRGVL